MYKIIYDDGWEYQVEKLYKDVNMNQARWDAINKPIRRFEYHLNGKIFMMENYEMFNHLIEYAHISVRKGLFLSKITLMGLSGNIVTAIVLNIMKKRIEKYHAKLGQEYNGGITTGWKKGTCNKSAGYSIN